MVLLSLAYLVSIMILASIVFKYQQVWPRKYAHSSFSSLGHSLPPKDNLLRTYLTPPVKYFTDRSKAVLLLWIFYVLVLSCVCYVFVRVCLYVAGKGLTSWLSLSHWYPGPGMVLDCIDS